MRSCSRMWNSQPYRKASNESARQSRPFGKPFLPPGKPRTRRLPFACQARSLGIAVVKVMARIVSGSPMRWYSMKKLITAGLIGLLMIVSYALGRRHSEPATESARSRRILYWVDPMHPDYKSDHPGKAPDCGMPLEPVYADSAASPSAAFPAPAGAIAIDPASQRLVGIRVATPEKTSGTHTVRFLGRVAPEDTRTYMVNSGTDGFIR